ncbi:Diguanylate phosphodiesterase [Parafrankia sp. Ea1.12]|uniref:sensor domain-containing phosphodiesterase n=1 Tax=Parafrankia sp. Ea1.12 TaxID=573499 RepID=UPI000DA4A9AA|nr:EAL domain-containing protein [Parafrankia sp. Ea1.12]SQD95438.1 Diguanylate phosphodiesterase [Parafrankia sp. Ea1.12]
MTAGGLSILGTPVDVPEPDTPDTPDTAVVHLLGVLRNQLGMDLSWLCRFDGDRLVLQAHNGDGASYGVGPGTTVLGSPEERERTLYWRVLTGRLPPIIPDTLEDPRTAGLPTITELGVRAYAATPVRDGDRVYGVVGCIGRVPRPDLDSRHVQILMLIADLLSVSVRDLHRMWEHSGRTWRAVREVLDSGGPRLVFQPVVDLRTGSAVAAEALARFPGPPADPQQWFARAAGVGLGVELELSAVRRALGVLPAIPANARLAVNASPTALTGGLLGVLPDIDLTRLVVEITEQERSLDDPAVLRAARELRARGTRIAVDDVGAGYAGLARLVQLRPDVIKMDRCLIHGIDTDPVRRATAIALVYLAGKIGSRIIAEGIETAAELTAVRDTGIGYGQGNHLGAPDPMLPVFHRPRWPGGPGPPDHRPATGAQDVSSA